MNIMQGLNNKQKIEFNASQVEKNTESTKIVGNTIAGSFPNTDISCFAYNRCYFNQDIPIKGFHLTNSANYHSLMMLHDNALDINQSLSNIWYYINKSLNIGDKLRVLWPIDNNSIAQNLQSLNSYHPFSIFYKHKDYIESFGVSCNRPDIDAPNLYFNMIEDLEKFAGYFKEKANDVIKQAERNLLHIVQTDYTIHPLNFKMYSPNIQITPKENYHITPKEKVCLKLLSWGQTYKEIGKTLDISPRTVEFHINNIKEKTSKQFRSQLVDYYKQIA